MKYFKTVPSPTALLAHSIIDVIIHLFLTLVISGIIYLQSRNLSYAALFIAGGVFVDLDHFIDYFLYHKLNFSVKDFFSCGNLKSGKVYLVFHSWEINLFLLLLSRVFNSPQLLLLGLGLSLHLGIDNLQRENPWCYFLVYRMLKRFESKVLVPEFMV